MTPKVFACFMTSIPVAEKVLGTIGAQIIQVQVQSEDDIIAQAADADAIIAGAAEPYTKKVISALTHCKIISRFGIGVSNIDVEEATRQGIPIAVVLDASVHEVSDYTIACILAFNRRLFPLTRAAQSGLWKTGSKELMLIRRTMSRLNQQTLGLVGMGRIGGLVAQKAVALGLQVLVYDPYLSPEAVRKLGAEVANFDHILTDSDYISLHAPLTGETQKLFGPAAFKKMKPTAYLINAARGGLVDEPALYEALTEGYIAGAALDVTDPEPPDPNNPLLNLDQVIATGHSSWFSDASMIDLQRQAAEAVVMALKGTWPPTLANPQVKERENSRIGEGCT